MAKQCKSGCGLPVFSKGLCNRCWKVSYGKPIKRAAKSIAPVSDKRKAQNKQYSNLRKLFLKDHAACEISLKGCTGTATEVHHAAGRENARLLDVKNFKAVCRTCHVTITEHSAQAIKKGWSKRRNASKLFKY